MTRFSQFNNQHNERANAKEEDVRRTYDNYKNMSQSQLNASLLDEVAKQKANGTFDYEALSNMVDSLRGVLPENDYKNVKRLLENIR